MSTVPNIELARRYRQSQRYPLSYRFLPRAHPRVRMGLWNKENIWPTSWRLSNRLAPKKRSQPGRLAFVLLRKRVFREKQFVTLSGHFYSPTGGHGSCRGPIRQLPFRQFKKGRFRKRHRQMGAVLP